ncbi:MAG TPA: helix-turn-helix transcriptional regulator [bacterium]|nr:helix-turn-helix transcriptional regulator [bacterium]
MEYNNAFLVLGERYRQLRTDRGMIQEDVLEHNFSVRHYQQLEAGRPHSLQTFFRLCKMFKVTPEDLIKGALDGHNGSRKRKK